MGRTECNGTSLGNLYTCHKWAGRPGDDLLYYSRCSLIDDVPISKTNPGIRRSEISLGFESIYSVGSSGTSTNRTPWAPYYSHTIPVRIPKNMGMVWEQYGKLTMRESHCWEFLESPLIYSQEGFASPR